MADTWDSVTAERKALQMKQDRLVDENSNMKRQLRSVLEGMFDGLQSIHRQRQQNLEDISLALDGPALQEIREVTEESDSIMRNSSYSISDYTDEQFREYDKAMNKKLDVLDEQDATLRKKLRNL